MRCAALSAAIVTTALVLVPRASAAQPDKPSQPAASDGEAVALSYQNAASGCPTEAEFRAEVTKLTTKARFTNERGARPIRIELERHGSGVLGRLVTGEDKARATREVRGKDCSEVSSALAIAVALTLDPDALEAGPGEPLESPAVEPPKPPEPVTKPPPPTPPPPDKPAQPARAKSPLLWGLGVGLSIESAWAPQLRAGAHALVLLGVGDHFRATLGATYFPTRTVDDVSFGAWLGQGSLSWNLDLLGILRPYAAVGYEAGAVSSSGSGLATTVEAQRPWQTLSAGLGIRLETDELFLQLGGSLLLPLSRQRYLISDPSGTLNPFYEVPTVGVRQETTLGVFL